MRNSSMGPLKSESVRSFPDTNGTKGTRKWNKKVEQESGTRKWNTKAEQESGTRKRNKKAEQESGTRKRNKKAEQESGTRKRNKWNKKAEQESGTRKWNKWNKKVEQDPTHVSRRFLQISVVHVRGEDLSGSGTRFVRLREQTSEL